MLYHAVAVLSYISACNQLQLHAVHNSVRNLAAFFARGLGLLNSVLISGVWGTDTPDFRLLENCSIVARVWERHTNLNGGKLGFIIRLAHV